MGAPTLALDANGAVTFTFTPASPDAAITYVFILEDQDGNVHESSAVGFASLTDGAGASKAYMWASAPSGQFKGKVRCGSAWHSPEVRQAPCRLCVQACKQLRLSCHGLTLTLNAPGMKTCRSINGVGSATSPESAELVVGTPGTPGKPTALSGQTGFVVTFSPGEIWRGRCPAFGCLAQHPAGALQGTR